MARILLVLNPPTGLETALHKQLGLNTLSCWAPVFSGEKSPDDCGILEALTAEPLDTVDVDRLVNVLQSLAEMMSAPVSEYQDDDL